MKSVLMNLVCVFMLCLSYVSFMLSLEVIDSYRYICYTYYILYL
jgi:hypothetical protein